MKLHFKVVEKSPNGRNIRLILVSDKRKAHEGTFDRDPGGELLIYNLADDVSDGFRVGREYVIEPLKYEVPPAEPKKKTETAEEAKAE